MKKILLAFWDKPERLVAVVAIIGAIFVVIEIRDRRMALENHVEYSRIQSKI